MSFEWGPALATGHEGIDRQRREILARAAELSAALLREDAEAQVFRALGTLAEYVYDHLDAEERLMAAAAYPRLAEHRRAHEELCRRFAELAEAFRIGGNGLRPGPGLAPQVAAFTDQVVARHVLEVDQDLATYLAAVREGGAAPLPSRCFAGTAREALDAARHELDLLENPACLLDPASRIQHCNPAWNRFAAENDGDPAAVGGALRGREYLSCIRGDPMLRQLGGLLRLAQGGIAQEISATCHTAEVARLLTARYDPVLTDGGDVAGVAVAFRTEHVFPIADLFEPQPPDDRVYLGAAGRLEACASCGRVRRRDRAMPTWEFVPAYLGRPGPPVDDSLCGTCFTDLFGLTRG